MFRIQNDDIGGLSHRFLYRLVGDGCANRLEGSCVIQNTVNTPHRGYYVNTQYGDQLRHNGSLLADYHQSNFPKATYCRTPNFDFYLYEHVDLDVSNIRQVYLEWDEYLTGLEGSDPRKVMIGKLVNYMGGVVKAVEASQAQIHSLYVEPKHKGKEFKELELFYQDLMDSIDYVEQLSLMLSKLKSRSGYKLSECQIDFVKFNKSVTNNTDYPRLRSVKDFERSLTEQGCVIEDIPV